MAESDDILAQGKKLFALAEETEADNRATALADIEFSRKSDQWDSKIAEDRRLEGRPMLTINKLPAFIRQVVNDARQNKPGISVHPVDSDADPETAEVVAGLIRNIEATSNADIAYDTATECAVQGGIGYLRVVADYAYDDSFDMDLMIKRVANPFSIYGDPNSVEADSSDWMDAFAVEKLTEAQFKAKWKGKTKADWNDTSAWGEGNWHDGTEALVAEWWHRSEAERKVQQFLDQRNMSLVSLAADDLADEGIQALINTGILVFRRERMSKTYTVKQRFMSGAELLEERDWPGCYIPIIPVYGEEFDIKGKRYFRGLIHNAIDAQRMFNYWRTTATELVALAPRVPYIGPKGSFDSDPNWQTANRKSHPFLEYDIKGTGGQTPQRQPLDSGVAAGALQEALNAADDMKAVIGMYDASLGARSNETSGKAILARQREGDVSTFHFMDNMSRAIRHTGRVLIDLLPHFYNAERVIRVMGEDGTPKNVQLGKQYQKLDDKTGQPMQDEQGQPVLAMHDLSVGKYDLTVKAGPGYTTLREEAANGMTAIIQAYPDAAPIIAPELFKNLDWPGADKIAEKFEQQGQIPPEVQKALDELKAANADLEQQLADAKADNTAEQQKVQGQLLLQKDKQAGDFELGKMKIASDRALALAQNGMEEQPGAEGEEGKIVSNDQARSEAIMQGLVQLGTLVATEGQATRAALQQIATIIAAPTQLVRDADGRPAGARKIIGGAMVN